MELMAQDIASNDIGGRIIKVNHAGEHGAVNIYSGQIFMARKQVFKKSVKAVKD